LQNVANGYIFISLSNNPTGEPNYETAIYTYRISAAFGDIGKPKA
jgi:hypothetical protein